MWGGKEEMAKPSTMVILMARLGGIVAAAAARLRGRPVVGSGGSVGRSARAPEARRSAAGATASLALRWGLRLRFAVVGGGAPGAPDASEAAVSAAAALLAALSARLAALTAAARAKPRPSRRAASLASRPMFFLTPS